jgi:hypothetical protein
MDIESIEQPEVSGHHVTSDALIFCPVAQDFGRPRTDPWDGATCVNCGEVVAPLIEWLADQT